MIYKIKTAKNISTRESFWGIRLMSSNNMNEKPNDKTRIHQKMHIRSTWGNLKSSSKDLLYGQMGQIPKMTLINRILFWAIVIGRGATSWEGLLLWVGQINPCRNSHYFQCLIKRRILINSSFSRGLLGIPVDDTMEQEAPIRNWEYTQVSQGVNWSSLQEARPVAERMWAQTCQFRVSRDRDLARAFGWVITIDHQASLRRRMLKKNLAKMWNNSKETLGHQFPGSLRFKMISMKAIIHMIRPLFALLLRVIHLLVKETKAKRELIYFPPQAEANCPEINKKCSSKLTSQTQKPSTKHITMCLDPLWP